MIISKKHLLSLIVIMIVGKNSIAQNVSTSHTLEGCENLKNTYFGSDGWIFEDWELQNTFSFTDSTAYRALQDALEKRGTYLIALPIPSRPYGYINTVDITKYPNLKFSKSIYKSNWNSMINLARKSGINIVDILPAVDNFKATPRNENFFYTGDHHWTTSGAQASAKLAAAYIDTLVANKKFSYIKTEKQVNETQGKGYSGSFNYHYIVACNKHIDDLKTYKVAVSSASESLLDEEAPVIGVFGDSFGLTDPDNNFAPYLEYYTKAKVINYSVEGGGFFGSMLGYFSDPDTNKNLPKIIIVPAQGVLQNDTFSYSEALATLNLCRDSVISTDQKILLPNLNNWINIKYDNTSLSKSSVIYLKFDHQVGKFELKVVMKDGKESNIEINRYFPESFHGSRTDYYLPIANAKNITSISLKIDDKDTVSRNVLTKLCKS